jgi:hypothetical protein
MSDPTLRNVQESLLREGIAPRHVNRYVMELRDHLTDLVERECAAGADRTSGCEKAQTILGTESQLVQAMLDRSPPRSLAARAPWFAFGLLPILSMLVLTIILGRLSLGWFAPYRGSSLTELPESVGLVSLAVTAVGSYGIGLLLVLGCVVTAVRQRLDSAWIWAGVTLVALACAAIGLHIEVLTAVNGTAGIRGSVLQTALRGGEIDIGATALLMSARALGFLALAAIGFSVLRRRIALDIT